MEIGHKFNLLTLEEYFFYIDNYKKYKDFNTLGLYRSIVENEKLNIEEKIKVREYSHKTFKKTFDFLQLKDPVTFIEVSTLGQYLTSGDQQKIWKNIQDNQQKILSGKGIKHRNFGIYSKHQCPNEDCIWNGVMLKKGSGLLGSSMYFLGDKINYHQKVKSELRKAERKMKKQIVRRELYNE